mmetsp:Transcript_19716/g.28582  ORF Transcript_19716/g.28582 Transcript_19716/m.28582 type:complete len:105 (-) Transcript_19716:517-831(-)
MNFMRSIFRVGEKPRSRSDDENKENDGKTRCCSGSFCTRASDPLLSDNKCPACMMAVHPLCEVWSSPHQEHICRMCDAGAGEENSEEDKFPVSTVLQLQPVVIL